MINPENFKKQIFSLQSNQFNDYALKVFEYQYTYNKVYRAYCDRLEKAPQNVFQIESVPFLPIEFFKSKKVVTEEWAAEKIFKSSGTTFQSRSKHHVKDVSFYHRITKHTFEEFYGPLDDYEILALLPSYQEQGDSSLISMIDYFMQFASSESSYYLHNHEELIERLNHTTNPKRLLIGVSYALLDLAEKHSFSLSDIVIMETGGMKGRRKEMIREELHEIFKQRFGAKEIHSEYGMSELSSQGYSVNGFFKLPNWSKILIRDTNDPFTYLNSNKTGGINIIDLANIHSCAFLETKDLGKLHSDGTFSVLGRFDNSDVRGCNLLIS